MPSIAARVATVNFEDYFRRVRTHVFEDDPRFVGSVVDHGVLTDTHVLTDLVIDGVVFLQRLRLSDFGVDWRTPLPNYPNHIALDGERLYTSPIVHGFAGIDDAFDELDRKSEGKSRRKARKSSCELVRSTDLQPQSFIASFDATTGMPLWARVAERCYEDVFCDGDRLIFSEKIEGGADIRSAANGALIQHLKLEGNVFHFGQGRVLYVTNSDGTVVAYELDHRTVQWEHGEGVEDAVFHHGNVYAVGNGSLVRLNANLDGRVLAQTEVEPKSERMFFFGGRLYLVNDLANPERIQVFDRRTLKPKAVITNNKSGAYSMLANNHAFYMSEGNDRTVVELVPRE